MRRDAERTRAAAGAVVVHDVALLTAVFYAPILWGGFNTSGQAFITGAVGLAALASLFARWIDGRPPARIPNAIHLPAVAFLAISAISAMFSVSWHASMLELCRLGVGVLLFWLVANRALLRAAPTSLTAAAFGCSVVLATFIPVAGEAGMALKLFSVIGVGVTCAVIASGRKERDATQWLGAALLLSAALVVALYGLREKLEAWRVLENPTWQIFSTFFNPNPLAGFFAMVFPLAVSAALVAAVLWQRMVWGFCGLLVAVMILPTYSKGGMLAFLVAAACYVVLIGWPKQWVRRVFAGALAAGVVGAMVLGLAVLVSQPVRARVASAAGAQSASNMFRILTWKGTIDLAAAYPWLGAGPGTFKLVYPKYATAHYVEAAHQNYLQVFAEQGVFGGAIFLWVIGAVVFTGKRALTAGEDFRRRALAVGGLCSIIALLVHSFLDYDWYIGAIGLMFWLVAGMLAHQAHGRTPEAPAAAEEKPRGRRRRAGGASPAERPRESAGRALPWPRGEWGRGAAVLAAAGIVILVVWRLTAAALAAEAVSRGGTAYMSGQYPTALRLYEQATRYDRGSARAWESYGALKAGLAAHEQREDVREWAVEGGKEAMARAMELEPTSFRAPKSLAQFYDVVGDLESAVKYYLEALDRFPKDTKTLRKLASVYQRLGEEEKARGTYGRMLEIEDSPYNRYRALASVDVDTEYAYAHYELGRLAVRDYERGERSEGLEHALSEFGEALGVIQEYFEKAKETDDMFRMLRRPREHRGEYMTQLKAQVLWRRGAVYERLGETERAQGERAEARAVWPGVVSAIETEGQGQ